MITPEGSLFLTSEAVWGMVAFATMAITMASGGIYAAWEARTTPPGLPWEEVDLEGIVVDPRSADLDRTSDVPGAQLSDET